VFVRKKPKAFWQEQDAAERWLGEVLSPSTHDDVPTEPKDKPEAKSEDGDGEFSPLRHRAFDLLLIPTVDRPLTLDLNGPAA
jgi:hypothetical protein